jgi:hypothetical protein
MRSRTTVRRDIGPYDRLANQNVSIMILAKPIPSTASEMMEIKSIKRNDA